MNGTGQLTLWWEEAPASLSPSQERESHCKALPDSCLSTYGLLMKYAPDGSSGRTSQGRSPRKGSKAKRGGAFRQLLREMGELGYGCAWRILDAQFARVPDFGGQGLFGPVAQRRRRVFLVGHTGDDPSGPVEVLFERESLRGDNPPSREKRKALAAAARGSSAGASAGFKFHQGSGAGGVDYGDEQSPTLTADYHQPAVLSFKTDHLSQNGRIHDEDGIAFTVDTTNSNALVSTQFGDVAGTLTARADSSPCVDRGQNVVCMESSQERAVIEVDKSPTLNASHEQPIVCVADDNGKAAIEEDMCGSLKVGGGHPLVALPATETM